MWVQVDRERRMEGILLTQDSLPIFSALYRIETLVVDLYLPASQGIVRRLRHVMPRRLVTQHSSRPSGVVASNTFTRPYPLRRIRHPCRGMCYMTIRSVLPVLCHRHPPIGLQTGESCTSEIFLSWLCLTVVFDGWYLMKRGNFFGIPRRLQPSYAQHPTAHLSPDHPIGSRESVALQGAGSVAPRPALTSPSGQEPSPGR